MNNSDKTNPLEVASHMGLLDDPKLKLMSQLLDSSRRQSGTENDEARLKRLKKRRRVEKKALNFLRAKNAELAAACGACVCWGDRPGCLNCRGRGAPGWLEPDEDLFMTYLEPVLRRIGLVVDEDEMATRQEEEVPS